MNNPAEEVITTLAMDAACRTFNVPEENVRGRCLAGGAWEARAAFSLALYRQGLSWERVGSLVGRHHSGPRGAVKRLALAMLCDTDLAAKVEAVIADVDARVGLALN